MNVWGGGRGYREKGERGMWRRGVGGEGERVYGGEEGKGNVEEG